MGQPLLREESGQ